MTGVMRHGFSLMVISVYGCAWSDGNPYGSQQMSWHSKSAGTWCAVSACWIFSSIFFHQTGSSNQYVNGI